MNQQAGRSEGEEILDEAAANDSQTMEGLECWGQVACGNREPQSALGQGPRRKMVVAAWAERVAELRLESGRPLREWGGDNVGTGT